MKNSTIIKNPRRYAAFAAEVVARFSIVAVFITGFCAVCAFALAGLLALLGSGVVGTVMGGAWTFTGAWVGSGVVFAVAGGICIALE